jgi:hypothetical protein
MQFDIICFVVNDQANLVEGRKGLVISLHLLHDGPAAAQTQCKQSISHKNRGHLAPNVPL